MRPESTIPVAIGADHWFAKAFALAFRGVVEALDLGGGAGALEVQVVDADPARWREWSDPVWLSQSWSVARDARLWVGCSAAVPQALWSRIGGAAGPEAAAEAMETFREVLNQSASEAAAETASRLGNPVDSSPVEAACQPAPGWAVELRFATSGHDCAIVLAGNVALARAMEPGDAPSAAPPAGRQREETTTDPLEMIREVSLELAVSFGDTTMRLADVLRLSSGAIIELNRSVSDPVELLVNDSVIARGDVVVVDGNYGVRITEIVSRRERVRSML